MEKRPSLLELGDLSSGLMAWVADEARLAVIRQGMRPISDGS